MEYYVYHEGRQVGPLSVSEVAARLANGDFSQSDHVWHEGLNHSKALSEVFRSQPKTTPHAPAEQPENHQRQTSLPLAGQQPRDQSRIPTGVMETIRAFARKEYPDDYSMQKYTIDEQCESFSAIQRISNANIPSNVFAQICEKAATEYPDDYSMQKYTIEEQIEAYRQLNSK